MRRLFFAIIINVVPNSIRKFLNFRSNLNMNHEPEFRVNQYLFLNTLQLFSSKTSLRAHVNFLKPGSICWPYLMMGVSNLSPNSSNGLTDPCFLKSVILRIAFLTTFPQAVYDYLVLFWSNGGTRRMHFPIEVDSFPQK